ncbi:MAG TPA: RtcB family protein [Candidatus Hydrogenedentes bacterium]|nr:RtcB family protein [Candidatus Hydrogenedentota bacterium]HPG67976.1 RtcB family protein [Candidatus Hydrogenedentota bacterium]
MTETVLRQLDETTWEVAKRGAMRVPGRIIANHQLLAKIRTDKAADQVANVACLPGIVGYSLAMPDAHWGYGFPIGGVAAMDPDEGGVISPGGVGYDINCGCRLMTTWLDAAELRPRLDTVVQGLYRDIPCGVGSSGAIPKLSSSTMNNVLKKGARWALDQGYGAAADLDATEDRGCLSDADPAAVSERAIQRGENQLGTLGSGNHFVELGAVEHVFDAAAASAFGLAEGRVTLMIHSGSRGLGYQICDDSIQVMLRAAQKYGIALPDRQLCCAPVDSSEGRAYLAAMACAANYAWANRQIIMELARRSLQQALGISPRDLGARLVYDVCHNIAKFERHDVDGVAKRLCVHRKGATRAFPGSRDEVPSMYRAVGQPVLIPGDMGTGSYVCVGTEAALERTFGSCCHGAGRVMSRSAAKKAQKGHDLMAELEAKNIVVMARSKDTLVEEAPGAYKDVDAVVGVVERAGIGRRVARIRPLGVIKG